MDRSAFVGVVESSIIGQGTSEESHPPMPQATGIQAIVSAVDLPEAHKLTPAHNFIGEPWETLS